MSTEVRGQGYFLYKFTVENLYERFDLEQRLAVGGCDYSRPANQRERMQ